MAKFKLRRSLRLRPFAFIAVRLKLPYEFYHSEPDNGAMNDARTAPAGMGGAFGGEAFYRLWKLSCCY